MFAQIQPMDFARLEGDRNDNPKFVIDDELVKLGGGGLDGEAYRIRVLTHCGHRPGSMDVSTGSAVNAYNQIVNALNQIQEPKRRAKLEKILNI